VVGVRGGYWSSDVGKTRPDGPATPQRTLLVRDRWYWHRSQHRRRCVDGIALRRSCRISCGLAAFPEPWRAAARPALVTLAQTLEALVFDSTRPAPRQAEASADEGLRSRDRPACQRGRSPRLAGHGPRAARRPVNNRKSCPRGLRSRPSAWPRPSTSVGCRRPRPPRAGTRPTG
jgi:hypothetical protein